MNTHSFSVQLAEQIGLPEAIILQHLYFWHEKNEANDNNIIDGEVWTYNSIKAFQIIFPYLTKNVIINSLKRLVDSGIIIEANHNKIAFDKTKWYSITEFGLIHFLKSEIELPKLRNLISEIKKPIPDSNTDIKPDSNTDIISWKNDFSVYLSEMNKQKDLLLSDKNWLNDQIKFNPNVNIKLTIEKSISNYWGTESTWVHKKKQKIKDINWKSTFANALSNKLNRVYLQQNQTQGNIFNESGQPIRNQRLA